MADTNITGGNAEEIVHNIMRFKTQTRTLGGNVTLTTKSPTVQVFDPAGARTVTLPAEADSAGLMFIIVNTADAAEIISVKDDAAADVITPTQAEAGIVWCDGVAWYGMVGDFA